MNIPVLMITYNRLEYTKKALAALVYSNCGTIIVIDNGSTDGTVEYLRSICPAVMQPDKSTGPGMMVIFSGENLGIHGAMNMFLGMTEQNEFVAKVDNDTIVPYAWLDIMLPYMNKADIIQAKHHIIPATDQGGWDSFVRKMKKDGPLYFNHFVGGSGILCRRSCLNTIPATDWKLGGWRQFQRDHPKLKKAFCEDVEIKLLDEHGYSDYPEYYKETKRL